MDRPILDIMRDYKQGKVAFDEVVAACKAIPPRERAVGGSPEWWDGTVSEWDDASRGVLLGYLSQDEWSKILDASGQVVPPAGEGAKALDLAAILERETRQARIGFERKSVDLLPEDGQTVWKRMHDSALRIVPTPEYATALAWRAVGQKYALVNDDEEQGKRLTVVEPVRLPRPATALILRRGVYRSKCNLRLDKDSGAVLVVGIEEDGSAVASEVVVPRSAMEPDRLPEFVASHEKAIKDALSMFAPREKRFVHQSKFFLNPAQAKHHIVYGEAYVPWEVDLQGEYATEEQVMRMGHGFMLRRGKIGEMHGRWNMPDGTRPGEIVESFLARRGDPDFCQGAWCIGVKAHPVIWDRVTAGEYKGFSIGGRWGLKPLALQVVLER